MRRISEEDERKTAGPRDTDGLNELAVASEKLRAVVLHPEQRQRGRPARDAHARLEEAVGLALAIELQVVHSEVLRLAMHLGPTSLAPRHRGITSRLVTLWWS